MITDNKKEFILRVIDSIGCILIGLLVYGYYIGWRNFAELRIYPSFLNFPVFIGEMVLIPCCVLFVLKMFLKPVVFKRDHFLFVVFFAFVLFKAFYGYFVWGPLAFRHAALFYYPMFAILTCSFFETAEFDKFTAGLIILMIIFANIIKTTHDFFVLAGIVTVVICTRKLSLRYYVPLSLLIIVMILPIRKMFYASRTNVVSNIGALVFFIVAMLSLKSIKKNFKIGIMIVLVAFFSFGMVFFSRPGSFKTLFAVSATLKRYDMYKTMIAEKLKTFQLSERDRPVALFHPNSYSGVKSIINPYDDEILLKKIFLVDLRAKGRDEYTDVTVPHNDSVKPLVDSDVKADAGDDSVKLIADDHVKPVSDNNSPKNSYATGIANSVYRLLIWDDMLKQFLANKSAFGIDFGKPFRAVNLEAVGWGYRDWHRDGWATAHNSYFEIIFRSGIVGVLFIIYIIYNILSIMCFMIKENDLTGIIICGVLAKFFIAPNFLLILELPYTAIPVWVTLGIAVLHKKNLEQYINERKGQLNELEK